MMNKSKYFSSSSSFSIKSFDPIGSSSGQLHHPSLTHYIRPSQFTLSALLYSMIAMSLHNVPIVEVEGFRPCDYYYYYSDYNASSSSTATDANGVHKKTTKQSFNKNNSSSSSSSFHLSITLPCKAFSNSSTLYNITIIFMDNGYADGGDLLLPAAASQ